MSHHDWPDRWKDLYTYLERPGPFENDGFEPGDAVKDFLHSCKILVIGAGGLGCELLKDLALSGFRDIHVIDMDTIDVSNLNRQFLFRHKDVGKPKAIVAAEFVMNRVPGVTVTPYFGKIQDKDEEYYKQFSIIICGLDSVEARRWANATIVGMFDEGDPETLKPIIDGGTEGFKGQSRVILPRISACYECSLDMQTKPTTFPMCTIANTPRLPEHCIEWASSVAWPKAFPDKKIDGDDPDHIKWLLNTALDRGREFNITGITYTLTQGVVKNIIPAIASTNAIVAASCANEAFKIATNCTTYMCNYMMYVGDDSVYTYTFELQRKDECPVCGSAQIKLRIDPEKTLSELLDMLLDTQEVQLKAPSLRTAAKSLFMQAPPMLLEMTRPNLDRKIRDLVAPGEEITITDANIPISLQLTLEFI
ncbi:NEDD8 activating enzyme [Polyrhizophydium stewartii]|uniref:NEDD8-activating enzyme E1 catalytic subunit n=1 Tax=Polyrhizophydium stewartii TaxID=2732419 RepID=A0ABR4N6C7_9FUNG